MNERGRLLGTLLLLNILWTPVNVAVRIATEHGWSPLAVATGRWTSLAILLQILLRWPWFARLTQLEWPKTTDRLKSFALGALCFGPAHALYYWGLTRGASSMGGTVLNATAPIWIALLAFLILRERATGRRLASILLGTVGAYIVVCGFALPQIGGDRLGNFLYLAGVLCEAIGTVLATQIVRRSSGIGFLAWQTLGMVPTFFLLPLLTRGELPIQVASVEWPALVALAYLVLFSGLICFGVWFTLAKRVPLSVMVVTILIQPPLSAVLAVTLGREQIEANALIGAGVIVAALFVAASEKGSRD